MSHFGEGKMGLQGKIPPSEHVLFGKNDGGDGDAIGGRFLRHYAKRNNQLKTKLIQNIRNYQPQDSIFVL